MIEDLEDAHKQIEHLSHVIGRVRSSLIEHPEDITDIDEYLITASDNLYEAQDNILAAKIRLEAFEAAKAKQQDENIQAAIALLESKGFIVGTKT